MVTSKNFAIRNFVYFCMNFPSDFIKKIWKYESVSSLESLNKKWNRAYRDHGTGAIPFFFIELDSKNQDKFCDWINKNYKGFEEFHAPDRNVIKNVNQKWIERSKSLNLKIGTKKHSTEQVAFFVGAMCALEIEPPSWVIPIISGRNIEEFFNTI